MEFYFSPTLVCQGNLVYRGIQKFLVQEAGHQEKISNPYLVKSLRHPVIRGYSILRGQV